MKKLLVVLTSILLLFTFVGCNKDNNDVDVNVDENKDYNSLIEILSSQSQYVESFAPGSNFIRVDKDGNMMVAVYCAGGATSGKITNVKLISDNTYTFTLEVPAFEGNELEDAHEAYSEEFTITYDGIDTVYLTYPEVYQLGKVALWADKAFDVEQLCAKLSTSGHFDGELFKYEFSTDGYYTRYNPYSDYRQTGKITDLTYNGFGQYSFKVYLQSNGEYPAMDLKVSITPSDENFAILFIEETAVEYENFETVYSFK